MDSRIVRPLRPNPALAPALGLRLVLALALALVAFGPPPLVAQTPPPLTDALLGGGSGSSTSEEDDAGPLERLSIAELEAEREAIEAEIEEYRSRSAETQDAAGEDTGDEAPGGAGEPGEARSADFTAAQASQLRHLEKTRSLLGQQIDELKRAQSLEQQTEELAELRRAGVGALVDHEAPFGFDDLDSVLSRLEAARSRRALLEDTVASGAEALAEAEKRLRQAQQERRLAEEKLEGAPAADRRALEEALKEERKTARALQEQVTQLRMQQANDRRELELVQERAKFLEEGVAWIRSRLEPMADALESRLESLRSEQEDLRDQMAQLEEESQRQENRLLRAESAGREAEAEVARTALDLLDQRQRLVEDQVDRRDLQAELWRLRHRLAASPEPDPGDREGILEVAQSDRAELERDRRLLTARLQDLRSQQARMGDLLESPDGQDAESLRRRQQLYEEQASFVEAQIADVEQALTTARRIEAEAAMATLDAGELAAKLWSRIVGLWQWQITVVDNRSITLGKVIIAVLLLILGYVASKRISHAFGRVLQRRFGLSGGAAAALQNIAFYLMLVAVLLWAMQLVSIPLTVFTLLGGVLAIGIGFGSQNVVNNFISGLILMVERPVKVGDLIEVDGTVGSVERIGLRSARVRSGDNTHIIVPNSTFLEQKVLNWTISDDLVRTYVNVGIAYGSDTRKAEKQMLKALEDEPLVVSNMPKEILFLDFGDNALLFRAYFWIRVRAQLDKARCESALRFRIEDLFGDAGIVIAFPQRDVHLDSLSPVQVRLLGGSGEAGPASGASETGKTEETGDLERSRPETPK